MPMTNHTAYRLPEQQLEPISQSSTELTYPPALAVQLAKAFLAGYESENTRSAYERDLGSYFAYCDDHEIAPLAASRLVLDTWARAMEAAELSPSTCARRIATISSYYRYCSIEGAIAANPVDHVRRPKVSNESQTLGLDLNELRALIATAEASSLRDRVLVGLLAQIGLRVSAACAANAEDLSLERGHNTITSYGKGGKILRRTLPPALYASIVELLDGRTEGPILRRVRSGKALDRFDAAKIVSRLAREAGIEKRISPHSLRHTAVTLYLDSGAELRDVSDAMGHASPTTTMRYDRARRSLERDPAYKLEAALAG